jgi:hypothetical protein
MEFSYSLLPWTKMMNRMFLSPMTEDPSYDWRTPTPSVKTLDDAGNAVPPWTPHSTRMMMMMTKTRR